MKDVAFSIQINYICLNYFYMENFIRYKRFTEEFDDNDEIQKFLDTLSGDDWIIISYFERPKDTKTLSIIILAGKRNDVI